MYTLHKYKHACKININLKIQHQKTPSITLYINIISGIRGNCFPDLKCYTLNISE